MRSTTGTLASTIGKLNPFRYRGYFYDDETKLYYVGSRYYDPQIRRWICADSYVSTGQGTLGLNTYVYCYNNPVVLIDMDGHRPVIGLDPQSETEDERNISFAIMNNRYVDLTDQLDSYMQENANYYSRLNLTSFWRHKVWFHFKEDVTDGGRMDIKKKEEWQFKHNYLYAYRGIVLRYDDPGNINYGFVGAALFPLPILTFFAGKNQVEKYGFKYGNIITFFDDERDNKMICYGYELYHQWRFEQVWGN